MATTQSAWVWYPATDARSSAFKHPGEVPLDDEAAARACFVESLRGPRAARISPATILQNKGNVALIAEKGATREVDACMLLPWYEGLLLLEALSEAQGREGRIPAEWLDDELREIVEKERRKTKNGRLNGTLYTERRLLNCATTGARFHDGEREYRFKRDKLKAGDATRIADGEDVNGFFRIQGLVGYLPPWEAFLHEKCGFYQDFYQVKWSSPFSEVDYAAVENGSALGSTWEPDECLPAEMDPLRFAAKKSWIQKRRELEQKREQELKQDAANAPRASPPNVSGSPPAPSSQPTISTPDGRSSVPGPPPVKRARMRRDGNALERDLLDSAVGHDFAPEGAESKFGKVCQGWPKKAEEYPMGFAVASPPGFCWANCDCMDDMRIQRSWETRKAWLEDSSRTSAAKACIAAFGEQTHFVFRRGAVSKRCYFETDQSQRSDLAGSRAAWDLSVQAERAVNAVLQRIPVAALAPEAGTVRLPARAYLSGEGDYEPLRYKATTSAGGALPMWLRVDPDRGRIIVSKAPPDSELPLQCRVELVHAEGAAEAAAFTIVAESSTPLPWLAATMSIIQRFDPTRCPLEAGVRAALMERFSEMYDFNTKSAQQQSLGAWLASMDRVLRLLRSASSVFVVPPS